MSQRSSWRIDLCALWTGKNRHKYDTLSSRTIVIIIRTLRKYLRQFNIVRPKSIRNIRIPKVELPFCEPGNGWSCKVVFAESYRLCVPELKSVRWQCAIFRQFVGTTKIQDGCRDPGKLQMCSSLHYIMLGTYFLYTHALAYGEFNGTVCNIVRLCPHDQNPKWPPFFRQLSKIKHNLIEFCYIYILFCPFLCFT